MSSRRKIISNRRCMLIWVTQNLTLTITTGTARRSFCNIIHRPISSPHSTREHRRRFHQSRHSPCSQRNKSTMDLTYNLQWPSTRVIRTMRWRCCCFWWYRNEFSDYLNEYRLNWPQETTLIEDPSIGEFVVWSKKKRIKKGICCAIRMGFEPNIGSLKVQLFTLLANRAQTLLCWDLAECCTVCSHKSAPLLSKVLHFVLWTSSLNNLCRSTCSLSILSHES